MTKEDKDALIVAALGAAAIEGIKVVYKFIDRRLAHWQDRKEEKRRLVTRQAHTEDET